jgi:hypothetical protein
MVTQPINHYADTYSEAWTESEVIPKTLDKYSYRPTDRNFCIYMLLAYWAATNVLAFSILVWRRDNFKYWRNLTESCSCRRKTRRQSFGDIDMETDDSRRVSTSPPSSVASPVPSTPGGVGGGILVGQGGIEEGATHSDLTEPLIKRP